MKQPILFLFIILTFSSRAQWIGTSLEFTSPGTSYTKTQLAEHTWSGSHALLFNAYKSVSTNGSLLTTGNTKYANNSGAFSGGAGAVMFFGNGGRMDFLISPVSTGINTDVNWGAPKMTILRNGRIGMGTSDPDGHLSIVGNSTSQVKLHVANTASNGYSVIRFSDTDQGSGKAYIHRFNANWSSSTPMWEANSVGFYESVGSMNIGGTSGFKVFTGSTSLERVRVDSDGNVGIGTTTPSHKLEVNGTIRSKEVKVEASSWPDYVFEPDYELCTLEETEAYIKENKHLPEIPSAEEVEENGLALGEMNGLLLKKIEELTLHTIEQQKLIEAQSEMLEAQNRRIENLEKNQK